MTIIKVKGRGSEAIGRRNLVINGAMQVAQRGTSSTSSGHNTVDRFAVNFDSGLTEAPTQAQVTLSSSDTPYSSGLRYALKITNGNQTSQDANDYIQIAHKIEAQDIAQSGWNYTSSSSNITLSFWVKASIAQTMYARLNAEDTPSSDARAFSFAFSATTSWSKITKTISGDSNLAFNNDTGIGLAVYFIPFYGTNYTTSGHTNDAWVVDSGSDQVTDMANTWFSGNDATLEVTGVQLEVGDHATDFEHLTFDATLRRCQRYFIKHTLVSGSATAYNSGSDGYRWWISFPTQMRDTPTMTSSGGTDGGSVSSFGIIYSSKEGYTPVISSNDSTKDVWYYGATVTANASDSGNGGSSVVGAYQIKHPDLVKAEYHCQHLTSQHHLIFSRELCGKQLKYS